MKEKPGGPEPRKKLGDDQTEGVVPTLWNIWWARGLVITGTMIALLAWGVAQARRGDRAVDSRPAPHRSTGVVLQPVQTIILEACADYPTSTVLDVRRLGQADLVIPPSVGGCMTAKVLNALTDPVTFSSAPLVVERGYVDDTTETYLDKPDKVGPTARMAVQWFRFQNNGSEPVIFSFRATK